MITIRDIPEQEFAGLRNAWNALLGDARAASPMLSWEWMFTWWEFYRSLGGRRQLRLRAAETDEGRLVGLFPLVRRTVLSHGIPLRRAEFMGTGEPEADETCSEFLDFIVTPAAEDEAARAFVDRLLLDSDWDELLLSDTPGDRPRSLDACVEALREQGASRPVGIRQTEPVPCPVVALADDWDRYLATRSRNGRMRVRRKRRKLEKDFDVTVTWANSPQDIASHFPQLVRLHQQRWQKRGQPGCFAGLTFTGFLETVSQRLAERGGARLFVLSLNGQPVSAHLLLVEGKRMYHYCTGTDVDGFGKHGPGDVAFGYILEQAMRDGFEEFHFFKAGRGSYKFLWTDQARPVVSLRVRRRTVRAAAADTTDACLRRVREVATRLRPRERAGAKGEAS